MEDYVLVLMLPLFVKKRDYNKIQDLTNGGSRPAYKVKCRSLEASEWSEKENKCSWCPIICCQMGKLCPPLDPHLLTINC